MKAGNSAELMKITPKAGHSRQVCLFGSIFNFLHAKLDFCVPGVFNPESCPFSDVFMSQFGTFEAAKVLLPCF